MTASNPRRLDVTVDGGWLSAEIAGAGPDLLLVHSGITDRRMWDDQMPALRRHFRVARYDLRGFGSSSDVSGPYSHVDDLRAVIAALGLERPVVVAASLGARVALDLAVDDPGLFDRMVLVGPAISGARFEDPAFRAVWQEIIAAYDAGDVERAIELETAFWVHGPTRPPGTEHRAAFERVMRMQRDIWSRAPDDDPELEPDPPAVERLSTLSMPILIIVGEHDLSDIHRNANRIVSDAADAREVVMPGLGHLPNLEGPDGFNRLILDFLSGTSTT